jgi:hypothetical protein
MIFNGGYKVTQNFGERPDYYKQFKLKGHEGLDVIPKTSDWSVLCLADGVVVKDQDDPRSGAYGDFVTIWHPQLNKATQYCHFEVNNVNINDKIKAGQKLGKMGSTGNSSGPHCHINLFITDSNGDRLNRDNGYQGGVDPLPFIKSLEEGISTGETNNMANVSISNEKFTELVRKATQFDTIADATGVDKNDEKGGEKVTKIISDLKSSIDESNKTVGKLNEDLTTANAEVKRLSELPPEVITNTVTIPVAPKTFSELVDIIVNYFKGAK